MKLIITYLIIIHLNISYKQNENKEINKRQIQQTNLIEEKLLKNFKYEDVAKYAISSIMNQQPKIIKVVKKQKLYYVSYIRKSDKKKYEYKIKFDGNKILWSNIDGRWRDSNYDEKISFLENKNVISIIQTFSDGSTDIQKYKKGE